MKISHRRIAVRAISLLVAISAFVFKQVLNPEYHFERTGTFQFRIMTESGVAFSTWWGAFASYIYIVLFLVAALVWQMTSKKGVKD